MSDDAVAVATALATLLGSEKVSGEPELRAAMAHDMLRATRAATEALPAIVPPLAVVRPAATADIVETLRFAAQHRLAVVALGGATGLMGGGRSITPGIVLDLRSLNQILEVNQADRTVRVQAGVVLADLETALRPHGLILGHDPWTVPVATVGGAISTNGLGYRGARYGSMGDQALGLEVVLADGSVVRTNPAVRASTGPRLRHLFIGAEGTLGIISEAVLRVFPEPERRLLRCLDFPDFDRGFHAVEALFAIGLVPALLDFGQTYGGPRDRVRPFTPAGARGRLQLGFEGYAEEVEAAERRALAICREHGATLLPQAEADRFWQERHVDAERFRVRRPEDEQPAWLPAGVRFDFVHVALPASQVLPYRDRAGELLAERGVSVVEWGLWNQPELFSVVIQQRVRDADEGAAFTTAVDELPRLAQAMGGSMEYCHGVGLRLAALMQHEHGQGLELLRAIKATVDPSGILNPGKLGLTPDTPGPPSRTNRIKWGGL